jgi:flagellar biosynthesis GTPase FlhF
MNINQLLNALKECSLEVRRDGLRADLKTCGYRLDNVTGEITPDPLPAMREFYEQAKENAAGENSQQPRPSPDSGAAEIKGMPANFENGVRPKNQTKVPESVKDKQAIAIVGLPASGKSAYLFVLGHQLIKRSIGNWRMHNPSDDFLRFYLAKLQELESGWLKTLVGDVSAEDDTKLAIREKRTEISPGIFEEEGEPEIFRMFNLKKPGYENAPGIEFESFDAAGENWMNVYLNIGERELKKVKEGRNTVMMLIEQVKKCAGFLVILDVPELPENNSGEDDPAAKVQGAGKHEKNFFWMRFFDDLVKANGGPDGKAAQPVAIILNKADLQAERLLNVSPGNAAALAENKTPNENEPGGRSMRQKAAENFVRENFEEFYTIAKERLSKFNFFAISCWGRKPVFKEFEKEMEVTEKGPDDKLVKVKRFVKQKVAIVGENFKPMFIDEPLEWLADQIYTRLEKERLAEESRLKTLAEEEERVKKVQAEEAAQKKRVQEQAIIDQRRAEEAKLRRAEEARLWRVQEEEKKRLAAVRRKRRLVALVLSILFLTSAIMAAMVFVNAAELGKISDLQPTDAEYLLSNAEKAWWYPIASDCGWTAPAENQKKVVAAYLNEVNAEIQTNACLQATKSLARAGIYAEPLNMWDSSCAKVETNLAVKIIALSNEYKTNHDLLGYKTFLMGITNPPCRPALQRVAAEQLVSLETRNEEENLENCVSNQVHQLKNTATNYRKKSD